MSNPLGINSAADVRAVIYHVLPVATALLVTAGVLSSTHAALWAGLVTAIAGPGLALYYARSLSNVRVALYAILAAVQALAIGYGITAGSIGHWLPVVSALVAALGGGVAVVNTPVSSGWTKGANAGSIIPVAEAIVPTVTATATAVADQGVADITKLVANVNGQVAAADKAAQQAFAEGLAALAKFLPPAR